MAISSRRSGFREGQCRPRLGRPTGGFTLVELLVVITIIGMLVALLLPAVHAVRENARSTQCMNNLGNLAKAMASYDSSKGSYPGHSQFVKRSVSASGANWAIVKYDTTAQKSYIDNDTSPNGTQPLSWAALLLSRIERQDVWDGILNSGQTVDLRRIDTFICPSDTDAFEVADRPALTYVANCGAWDRDGTGNSSKFLPTVAGDTTKGDIAANGVFFDQWSKTSPKIQMRMSGINDGAATTMMLSENNMKSYADSSTPAPLFTWAAGSTDTGWEQQFGMVWVVTPTPQADNTLTGQERIDGNKDQIDTFDARMPRFARPGSIHRGGVNVAFCDAHTHFLRDDIDYTVYQQLMTSNGRKCADPADHNNQTGSNQIITNFRNAAPLSNQDF